MGALYFLVMMGRRRRGNARRCFNRIWVTVYILTHSQLPDETGYAMAAHWCDGIDSLPYYHVDGCLKEGLEF